MRAPLAALLCSCSLFAGAQEPAPGGFLELDLGDVPGLRAQLAASWHGKLWALPQASPLRAAVDEALAAAASATGVPWTDLARRVQRARFTRGSTDRVVLTLDAPTEPCLAAVPALARGIAERWRAHMAAYRAWEQAHGQREDGVRPPAAPGWHAAVALIDDGIVVGRSQSFDLESTPEDGWRLQAQGDALVLSHPVARGPTAAPGAPATPGVALRLDAPTWADAIGLPGIGETLRACGVGRIDGTIAIAEGRSRELARLPRVALPLRPVDLAALERTVPRDALALSAVGLDGAKLAALADRVAGQRADLAPFIAVLRPALAALDGTAWLAVLPGAERLGVVLGLPASDALDAWLARQVPALAEHLADATRAPVELVVVLQMTVTVKRAERCWLVASDAASVAAAEVGFIARLRTSDPAIAIPDDALALGLQDNQAVLRALARHAPTLATALRAPKGDEDGRGSALPAWLDQIGTRAASLLDALAAWAAAAKVPPSVGTLVMRDGDAVLAGQDLAVGALILPGFALAAVDVLPCLHPEWSGARHPLRASGELARAMPWFDLAHASFFAGSASFGWSRWSRVQTNTLALSSPIPEARALALSLLSTIDDPVQTAWAYALCRRALDDPDTAVSDGAWRGLCGNGRGHQDEIDRLLVGFLDHADPRVRLRAVESLEGDARTLRRKRSTWDDADWQPDHEPRLLGAALEPLLALEQRESDGEVLQSALVALSGFDDARILPRLRARLGHADPRVRTGALLAIHYCPAADHDLPLVQAVSGLLGDAAIGTSWRGQSVGDEALETLGALPGAEVDALLLGQLTAPDQPSLEPAMRPSRQVRLLQLLLRRGRAEAIPVIAQRLARPATTDDTQRLWTALGRSSAPEAETLLRAQLAAAAKDEARDELLTVLNERRGRHGLQRETIAAIVALIGQVRDDQPSHAAEIVAELLQDAAQQAAIVPLLVPLLTSARYPDRLWARSLIDDLPPTAPGQAEIAAAIAKAWKTFGREAFPDHEPPPAPEPAPGKTSDF